MLTVGKVTDLFYMASDFCKFFDKMTAKYTVIIKRIINFVQNFKFV